MFILLIVLAGISRFGPVVSEQTGPTSISVTPFVYVARETGEIFNVTVNISNAEDLLGCSLVIAYNTTLLDAIQVARGGFFPEQAFSELTINESEGLVLANASLPEASNALWGKGTLVRVSFKVSQMKATNGQHSLIRLDQTEIYDTKLEPIDHGSISAIYFWESIQPSQLQDERLVDLFTQKGGIGPGVYGGAFIPNEIVNLNAYVSFSDWPQQNDLVAFQVIDPSGQTVFVNASQTDEKGYATASFRIPNREESLGIWRVISSVDVACQIVWDTLSFYVSSVPVGGTSRPIDEAYTITDPSVLYMVTITILTVNLIGAKRKRTQDAGVKTK